MSTTHTHAFGILFFSFFFALIVIMLWIAACAFPTRAQDAQNSAQSELRVQLQTVDDQIAGLGDEIWQAKSSQTSLTQEINVLNKESEKQKLQNKEIDLSVREVEAELQSTTEQLNGLGNRLKEKKILLFDALQKLNGYDNATWVDALFSGGNLSDFFSQARYLQNIDSDIHDFISHINDIKANLEQAQTDLQGKKDDTVQLRNLSALGKQVLDQKLKEKSNLLAKTKGQEKLFQQGLQKSQKDKIVIQQQLYTLESVGVSMSLGEAVAKAEFTGQKTGVRPAFLLAIFEVESKLGTYVGGGSWRKDMNPQERPIFLQITSKLELDPDTMPVSKRPSYGWGGAMGAAQFIPSTWLLYENQIASLTGHVPPSPWNIEDAFLASGLKLVANGAGSQAHNDEHTAAAKYLGGGNYKKRVSQIYANSVMDWADYYQNQIDVLDEVSARGGTTAN